MNPGAALIYSVKLGGDTLELTFMRADGIPRGKDAPPYTIKMSRLEQGVSQVLACAEALDRFS
jgi:hypothetical protein